MRKFWIEAGRDSPYFYIDESEKVAELKGNSTLKDAHWFYSNVLKWMIAFNLGASRTEVVNLSLQRVNDSTSRWLALILSKFGTIFPDSQLTINCPLNSNNSRLRKCCELLREQTCFKVNFP